jgi:hypothetical protein
MLSWIQARQTTKGHKMIRRSANAPALIPISQKSPQEQKSFFDRIIADRRPDMMFHSDETILELRKCIDQGTYSSDLAASFLDAVK